MGFYRGFRRFQGDFSKLFKEFQEASEGFQGIAGVSRRISEGFQAILGTPCVRSILGCLVGCCRELKKNQSHSESFILNIPTVSGPFMRFCKGFQELLRNFSGLQGYFVIF